ncbi:MAG: nucleoside phosphorylase [Candidatus Bathyarchaeia archaeon]
MHKTYHNEKQYHIQCKPGDLAKYLLIPGDPERVEKIASLWDEAREISCHREFRAFTGKYKGVNLSALSSGIGPAAMAIVVNEAANIGVETFIRVGSCGSIQPHIKCGDLVILSGAVRLDGTSNNYAIVEYPALAHYEVLLALIEAAEKLDIKYHVGIAATTSDFYAGQARTRTQHQNLINTLKQNGVLAFEMEAATLFTLANTFKLRAGCICAVYANRITGEFTPNAGEKTCTQTATEAIKILNEWDKAKQRKKKNNFYPSLLKMGNV